MAHFSIASISSEGDVSDTKILGKHTTDFGISGVGAEKSGERITLTVDVRYSHSANDVFLFELKVRTVWGILELKKDGIDKARIITNMLLIRAVSHFNAILDMKMKEKGFITPFPEDPDFSRPIEMKNKLVEKFFE